MILIQGYALRKLLSSSTHFVGTENMAIDLKAELSKDTAIFGLKVWEVIGIVVGLFIVIILSVLSLCLMSKKNQEERETTCPQPDSDCFKGNQRG